jgi:hypothetical protein
MRQRLVWAAMLILAASMLGQTAGTKRMSVAELQSAVKNSEELTWRESIRANKDLSPLERKDLIRFLMTDLKRDMSVLGIESEKELHQVAQDVRVKLVDLRADGSREVIVQASGIKSGCSPTGNCPLSVLEKTETGYKAILDATSQTFAVQETRTNGSAT